MNKDSFEQWLIQYDNKKKNSAYSYKLAIPHLSEHYSSFLGHKVNLYSSDVKTIQDAVALYGLSGKFSDYGKKGNGTFRNALNALLRMKKNGFENNNSIDSLIWKETTSPSIEKLINESKFYFQYLLNVKDRFFEYQVSDSEIEKIIKDYDAFEDGTFEDFVLKYEDSLKPFLELLAEYISYLDKNASGKNRWNKYPDKRAIALAFVRMPFWVKHLLQLKKNPDLELKGSIKNAIEYSISPMDNLTVLSENHREDLSNNLLKKEYDESTFQVDIFDYFKPFGLAPKNKMNYTYLISSILYAPKIKSIWNSKGKDKIGNTEDKKTMTASDFFEKYKEFLIISRKGDISSKTINNYYESALYSAPGWIRDNGVNFEKILKNNKTELLKLKEAVNESQSGFSGFWSFQAFVNEYVSFDLEKASLNQIFFGPPGTGKTFKIIEDYITNTKTHIEKVDSSKQMIDLKKGFWHLAPGEGGYLWDELKKDNYLGYEYCSHYLKDLSKVSRDEPSWDMKKRFSKVKKGDYFCIISGKKFYAIAQALHSYDPSLSNNSEFDFQTIEVKWIKQFEKPELLNTSSLQAFSNLKGSKRWQSLLDALESQDIYPENKVGKEVEKSIKNYSLVSFHQSFSYEDFIEGIKPDIENDDDDENDIKYIIQDGIFKQSCDKAARLAGYEDLNSCIEDTKEGRQQNFQNAPPFYLLIDEINRGNISAIFGELITLIEQDKRLGSKYELMTDLPYSKREFGVPANLHIIGTMNTADRSVEALDTALRRRFSFVEVAPNTNIIKDKHPTEGIILDILDLNKMLEKINDRIELLINKDHKIGHSYLIKITTLDDLKKVFTDKIIPLMEEYFYGDFGKIGLVLGNQFVDKVEDKEKTDFAEFNYDDRQALREKLIYKFTPSKNWSIKSFISIYNSSILKETE